jgi:cytochrome bd-type quinol oxidase subunit 1
MLAHHPPRFTHALCNALAHIMHTHTHIPAQVCGGSIVLSALSYPVARFWFVRNWKKANQTKLFEQKMLR